MGILRRTLKHPVYAVWDAVDDDPLVPPAARLRATAAARALYVVGIVGGAFSLTTMATLMAQLVTELDLEESKLGMLLVLLPAIGAFRLVWALMRWLQTRALQRALDQRVTIGASSSATSSSTAGAPSA